MPSTSVPYQQLSIDTTHYPCFFSLNTTFKGYQVEDEPVLEIKFNGTQAWDFFERVFDMIQLHLWPGAYCLQLQAYCTCHTTQSYSNFSIFYDVSVDAQAIFQRPSQRPKEYSDVQVGAGKNLPAADILNITNNFKGNYVLWNSLHCFLLGTSVTRIQAKDCRPLGLEEVGSYQQLAQKNITPVHL